MNIYFSSTIILLSLIIVIFLYFRHVKGKGQVDLRTRMAILIFSCEPLLVACDMCTGGNLVQRLPMDMILCIIGLSTITSSVWSDAWIKAIAGVVIAVLLTFSLYLVMVALGVAAPISQCWVLRAFMLLTLILLILYCLSLWWRIRDICAVMKSGTVWQYLNLSVDCIYVVSVTMSVILYIILESFLTNTYWHSFVISVVLAATTFAYGYRIINESLFVLFSKHERTIVESMKISHVEVANDFVREDDPYREIYERVVIYFEDSKPYLNSSLTINDVVKVVFTNKLYISRAISQYTGRNFCQFVNYYRVVHSVNLFRNNPDMKIIELANASGFNTVASFSMAFKLFMNENPSDWCRKERMKLIKGKNKLWNP